MHNRGVSDSDTDGIQRKITYHPAHQQARREVLLIHDD